MDVIFDDNDLIGAYKQKRKIFWFYMLIVALYAAICIFSIVYYVGLPFEDPMQALPKWLVWVSSCVFIIFSYIYLGIKFHRARRYYKLISYLSVGMKQVNNSIFLRYEEPELKDGVDFHVLIMSEWSKKKSEYMDRKIYSDFEKPRPQFQSGDKVRYLSQGNVIVEYEVVGHDDDFVSEKEQEDKKKKPIRMGAI